MKICYLSNSAIPSSVASAIQIVKMCEAFSKLNNDVTLISTNVSHSKENLFDFYNVKKKFRFKKLNYFKKFPLGFNYYLFSIMSIYESIKYKPDIYITRNFFSCFLLILLNKKVIIEIHHDLSNESRIVRFLVKYTKFLNSTNIKKLIAITESVKNLYKNKYSINENKFLVLPSGSSINKTFNFKNKKKFFKIGYFGSLYKSRGLDLIINLAKIDKKNSYYLYGNISNLSKYYFTKSIKNLYIKNYIPYKQIPDAISKMDILLLPYVSKITVAGDVGDITNYTSPLKLFDYLCLGKIIICSDFDVLKETLKERENAIFIKNYKNIASWQNEIIKLKNEPSKQLIISKNNYKLSKKYSLTNRAKTIMSNLG